MEQRERILIFDRFQVLVETQRRKEQLVFESPSLWVWAIIIGVIIAGKFAYRWHTTKELAGEIEAKKEDSEGN